jgi:hypothetical protein
MIQRREAARQKIGVFVGCGGRYAEGDVLQLLLPLLLSEDYRPLSASTNQI